ncbi:MAG: hypothetical protein V1709_08810 [Planctomycetota bacterium]
MTSKIVLILTMICMLLCNSLSTSMAYAMRISKPLPITDFDDGAKVIINDNLEKLFNVVNGRYNLNITTVNPDGVLPGEVGDIILLWIGGNYYLEINVGGTVWLGVILTDTP